MTIVIGLTGSFGSGCTYLAKNFLEKRDYKYISLSDILRETFTEENPSESTPERHELQEYGNKKRKEEGPDFLARKVTEKIDQESDEKWIIDSIRNPHEVKFLKSKYSQFYLIAVFADSENRWERVKSTYSSNKGLFEEDDLKDQSEKLDYGQRVRDCVDKADIIISNNTDFRPENQDYLLFRAKVDKYVNIIEKTTSFVPNETESFMAMAYANSMRSSCLKRKVGALIIDNDGNLFSSGFNEVPISLRTCEAEHGSCYRDILRNNYNSIIKNIDGVGDSEKELILERFKDFKILDYCRALHAEENAIINVVKFGSAIALRGATLYTSTYPCNLCANKIVQVGITKVVYLEPYPMEDAKKILSENNVEEEPFEGVSFNGYFRFGGL